MSDDGLESFRKRIERLEKKRNAHSEHSYGEDSSSFRSDGGPGQKQGRGFGDRTVGVLLIFGVIFALGALSYFSTLGRDSRLVAGLGEAARQVSITAALLIGGPPEGVKLPSTPDDDPNQLRKLADQGWEIRSPAVATPDRSEHVLSDFVTGYTDTTDNVALGQVSFFTPNQRCTFRRPGPGETVHNVRLETGQRPAPLQAFSEAQMAEAVTKSIQGFVHHNKPYLQENRVSGQFDVIDVFVTDTSAPVYLVLQSLNGNVLWNVQPAEGVQIAHVAIIGDDAGLVETSKTTSFEAIRVRDFIEGRKTDDDVRFRACMVRPWRSPEAHWPGVKKASTNNTLFVNQMQDYENGHTEFANWYQKALGVPVNANMTSVRAADHVLVGPKPITPLAYRPLANASIHLMQTDYVVSGKKADRDAIIEEWHWRAMEAAAGGDLANLTYMPKGDPS